MSSADFSRTTAVVQGAIASEPLFVSEDDIGYVAGQAIRFVPITEVFSRDHLVREDLIYQIPHVHYGFFRTCPNKRIFCIVSLSPSIVIFIHRYLDFREVARIHDVAETELLDVEFTYTKLLITLSGRPENLLKIWNWDTKELLCSLHLPNVFVPHIRLSSSTWNWRDFCVTGDNVFRLFSIDHAVSTVHGEVRVSTVTERFFQLPYSHAHPSKTPQDLFQCLHCSNPADFFSLEAIAQVSTDVVESFLDQVLERRRLMPTCHSWHVDGGVYIGTNEGRILYFHPHKCSTPPFVLTIDLPSFPIQKLQATKYGLGIMMQNGSYHFACMPSALVVAHLETPLRDIEVTDVLMTPSCEKIIAVTEHADVVCFEPPDSAVEKDLYSRKDFAKYLTIGKFSGGWLYTLQEMGVLKIWNYKDEPEFEYQLQVSAVCIAASPIMDYLAVGTSSGYVHMLDCHYCHNGRVPRLIHSVRFFDSAIRKIKFDEMGQVIMVTGAKPNNKMVVLSAQAGMAWKVLGFVNVGGAVVDCQGGKDEEGNVFVAVSIAGRCQAPATASSLATFRLSPALIDDPVPFHANTQEEFSPKCILFHKLKMRVDFHTFTIEHATSIIFATTTKHLVLAYSDTWTKTPDIMSQSTTSRPVVQASVFPEKAHVFSVTTTGCMSVRSLEDLSVVHKDDASVGCVKEAVWKQDQGGFHVYYVTQQGELIERTTPFLSGVETEKQMELTDSMREDMELVKSLPTSENDFVVRYEDAERFLPRDNFNEAEAWLTQKLRLFEEAKYAENLARSTAMKERFAHLKKKLMRYYEENETVNALQRLPDEWFDLVDDKFTRLKKKREAEIARHQLDAALEVIEHRLRKEKLVGRYLARLTTQRQCLYSLNSRTSLSNFPVPRRTQGKVKMVQIAELRRNLEKDIQEKAEQLPSANRVRNNSIPTNLTDFLSQVDYVLQTMAMLCDDEPTSKLTLFEDLYFDDTVTSRMQRVHQVVLLRECEWLLKEAFNRKFDELMSKKKSAAQMLTKRMEVIREKLENSAHGLTLPSMDLLVRNDEDPRKTLYQVSDEQILEYLNKEGIRVPLNFGRPNKNERGGTPVQPSTSAFLLSRMQVQSPLDDALKSPDTLIRESVELVEQFDKDLLDLQRLKDRVTFSVGMVQLRAMYLRVRMTCVDQIALHTEHLTNRIEEKLPQLTALKINITRSKKVVDYIKSEYDKIVQNDATLDHHVKSKLHEVSDLDGRLLVQIYRKRPHPLRGLKQVKQYNGQVIRPRSSELRDSVTADFFATVVEIEDTVHRPEDIELKTWIKFCELRRRKMECEMEFWMKHLEMDQHHGVLKDYVTLEKMLQGELDGLNQLKSKTESGRRLLARNADFVTALPHGQVEVDLKPFEEFNSRVIAIPLSRIEEKNAVLQAECKKKMAILTELVKHKEAVVLLEWEKEVHQQTISDYEYEKHFVESQAAPLEIRNMVGKDFEELRRKKESQLIKSLEQQDTMFEKELKLADEKVQQFNRKLQKLQKEREDAEAITLELTVDLVEQHAIGENIGIHADATESALRRDLVLKRLRLQGYVKEQKKRVLGLQQILLKWQKRTFPSIQRDSRVN